MIKSTPGKVEINGSTLELHAELTQIIAGLFEHDIIDARLLFHICSVALNKDVMKSMTEEEHKESKYADELQNRLGKIMSELFEALSDEDEEED